MIPSHYDYMDPVYTLHLKIGLFLHITLVTRYIKNVYCTCTYNSAIYNNIRFKSNGDFGFGVYIFDFEQVIQPTRVGWQQRFPFVIIYIRQLHIYILKHYHSQCYYWFELGSCFLPFLVVVSFFKCE